MVDISGLSGARRFDGWVVVTAVVADPRGACEAVQVLVADKSTGAAVRRLRSNGYRKVGTRLGTMQIDDTSAHLATAAPGNVFEREWLKKGEWLAVTSL
ncbi:hypothetical protein ACN26Y_16110 [Micromonospora sp. WMMD558]|uniref:hypothetical protein n=1 Tax=unclassified Micromonospora TaxID=2617518 RepID=UPI0012B50059|nr:hypothetical protein [Micromonospora sp. WMMC415]QGN47651.1 hypothetical protein GKC29_12870 [Micromonospora sp. WMMC415]